MEKVHDYYKALTVKLDRSRYEALKNAGVKLGCVDVQLSLNLYENRWTSQLQHCATF
jgi:hypothetical protein